MKNYNSIVKTRLDAKFEYRNLSNINGMLKNIKYSKCIIL